ncbi:MAG: nicotinate (nicotinamide) nucleotide adenylyltransferase [Terracidiphilus sp.]
MELGQPPVHGKRIAFFGGSFDPPHLGHLAVARAARTALALDTVILAPVGAQPLKPQGSTASFGDRLAMTRLAIGTEPGFAVSLADSPKPAGMPNFTLETLQALRAQLPSDGALFCLMGADSFFGLRQWHRSAEIPFVATLIVASRPGQRPEQWIAGLRTALPPGLEIESASGEEIPHSDIEVRSFTLRNAAGDAAPLYLLPGLHVEISASQIREQVRDQSRERVEPAASAQAADRPLLPEAVFEYIHAHGLYQ